MGPVLKREREAGWAGRRNRPSRSKRKERKGEEKGKTKGVGWARNRENGPREKEFGTKSKSGFLIFRKVKKSKGLLENNK